MSGLETIQLSHVPKDYPVHVALYRDLNNAKFLREQLISGNAEFEYAFIDASMVSADRERGVFLLQADGMKGSIPNTRFVGRVQSNQLLLESTAKVPQYPFGDCIQSQSE